VELLFARAVTTLKQPLRGIHLMWAGPPQFLFAPGGWKVERRPAAPFTSDQQPTCDEVSSSRLARLRSRLELKLSIGWMRLSAGMWDGPEPGSCEIFTLELDRPSTEVSGVYRGRHGLAIGLSNNKAVGYQLLPFADDGRRFNFGAAPVDQVVVYGLRATAVRCCVGPARIWENGAVIARLHLPLRDFLPALANDAGELAEARGRLAPGESLDPVRFKELTDILRVSLLGPGRRPIDNLLRMQGESEEPEEMFALDPLRALMVSPKWRRVMGFGFLDGDPALNPGASYDYRITGMFPMSERDSRVFGFHTIPPGTVLPADFSLKDCRFRLPNPVTVQAAPSIAPSGSQWVSRSGIPISPGNSLPWFGFGIDNLSASIDLPVPVKRLIFELDGGHDLKFVAGDPSGPMSAPAAVPAGERPAINFPVPVTQVNLLGKGFLFAIRIPADESDQMAPISTILPAVKFAESPLPEAPLAVTIANLQSGSPSTGPGAIRKLHALGIDVRWLPAPATGLPFWPADLNIPPPLDATMFEVERRIEPSGTFGPVLTGEDNAMFGSRQEPAPDRTIRPGIDLMQLFPEDPKPLRGADEFTYADAFSAPTETNPARRAPPPPGSILRYRVRTLDVIGRPSAAWRESNTVRLEKHVPPPAPAAYDPTPADQFTRPGPTGVYARILVKGASDLTPDESALLGSSDNAILLRWGWRVAQRNQDPFATHFRVYLSPTFDVLPGEILSATAVAGSPGDWQLQVSVPQGISANAAAGLSLNAGYPFFVVEHAEGTVVNMVVRTRIPDENGAFRQPAAGAVSIPLKLAPEMTQPRSWSERIGTVPIDNAEQYEMVIRDRLLLSVDHPRDMLWVGVTSADSEFYIPDTFPASGPGGPLPGNESPIVAVLCDARRVTRPEFNPPPPAGPVARVITAEPAGAPVHFRLDLTAFLNGSGLAVGELSQPERISVSALFGALGVNSSGQLMALVVNRKDPSDTDRPLTLPNPDDQASAVAAVADGSSAALEDRLVVRIAALHPYADRLFQAATTVPLPFGPFDETLPPTEERYVYRYRRADRAHRLSSAAAIANAVVRVPSLAPGPSPQRAPLQIGDAATRLRLRIPRDPRITHVLTFEHPASEGPLGEAELLRVPNRADLAPGATIRLRLSDGTVVAPTARLLGLPPIAEDWQVAVDAGGPAGRRIMVWASTLTADGVPSPPGGPWRVTVPKPDLIPPELSLGAAAASVIEFSWALPDPLITFSWLETSTDGIMWEPASAPRPRSVTSATVARTTAQRSFRVVGKSQDGRRAVSGTITV